MFDWQEKLGTSALVLVSSTATPHFTFALALVAHNTPSPAAAPKPSFSQALRGSKVIYTDPLPTPVIRGETLSIQIMKDAYVRGLQAC